jgi:hypothetical protein
MDKTYYIIKEIEKVVSAGESSQVELVVNISTGKSELVIEKTITERYPVTDYIKVLQLHKELNRGGGRRLWTLKDLTK